MERDTTELAAEFSEAKARIAKLKFVVTISICRFSEPLNESEQCHTREFCIGKGNSAKIRIV